MKMFFFLFCCLTSLIFPAIKSMIYMTSLCLFYSMPILVLRLADSRTKFLPKKSQFPYLSGIWTEVFSHRDTDDEE